MKNRPHPCGRLTRQKKRLTHGNCELVRTYSGTLHVVTPQRVLFFFILNNVVHFPMGITVNAIGIISVLSIVEQIGSWIAGG
jgi:hypothetical protein